MARENSFSDSDGRSLTPDLEDAADFEPVQTTEPEQMHARSPSASGSGQNSSSLEASATQTLTAPASATLQVGGPTLVQLERTVSAPDYVPELHPTARAPSTEAPRPALTPLERFRGSVRKVMAMNRTSGIFSGSIGAGAEPGIDPRRSMAFLQYGHLRANCTIEMVDYSAVRASFGRMNNKGFVEFLANPRASRREPWVKVRWINVGGISWDVISALAIKFSESTSSLRSERVSLATRYPPAGPRGHSTPTFAGSLESRLLFEAPLYSRPPAYHRTR